MENELVQQLRSFSRRHEPRSPERRLMLEAADMVEQLQARASELEGLVGAQDASGKQIVLTPDVVEKAMGAKLFPWQRRKLQDAMTPPDDPKAA